MINQSGKLMSAKYRQGDIVKVEGQPYSNEHAHALPRRERAIRLTYVALGVIILGYIYTDSLQAQQAAQQRISISQAVDFPGDI